MMQCIKRTAYAHVLLFFCGFEYIVFLFFFFFFASVCTPIKVFPYMKDFQMSLLTQCPVLLVDKPEFASLKGLLLFCPIRTTNIAGPLAEDAIG